MMNYLQNIEFLQKEIWNNTIQNYLITITLMILFIIILPKLKDLLKQYLVKITSKTKNKYDDMIPNAFDRIPNYLIIFLSFYFSILNLNLNETIIYIINHALLLILTFETISSFKQGLSFFIEKISKNKDKSTQVAYQALEKITILVIWIIATLFVLSNFGINVGALAAGLGIGGIAIAFAFKEILSDLFSYFVILLDKPLVPGDYVSVGDHFGTVQNIGIKTTRIKQIDGNIIVIPNESIASTEIKNFGFTKHRRVTFTISVDYDTSADKIKKIKKKVEDIINSIEECEFKSCRFKNFGDSALEIFVIYHINTRKFEAYRRIEEEINFELLKYFKKAKINIPFPTQTIFLKK